jgi:hypothetical protein
MNSPGLSHEHQGEAGGNRVLRLQRQLPREVRPAGLHLPMSQGQAVMELYVVCPICQAEWRDEKAPCIHLDLDSDWSGE